MIAKWFSITVLLPVAVVVALPSFGQSAATHCRQPKSDLRIRVSSGVVGSIRHTEVLPDASDLKSVKNADILVNILIDQDGSVICAKGAKGDPSLIPRSEEAALKWTFAPYFINGTPIVVEGHFVFHFHKGKVSVKFDQR